MTIISMNLTVKHCKSIWGGQEGGCGQICSESLTTGGKKVKSQNEIMKLLSDFSVISA